MISCSETPVEPPAGCDLAGECQGKLVNFDGEDNRDDCVLFCRDNAACNFWTFDPARELCSLFETFLSLDESSCPECRSGERDCPIGELTSIHLHL